MRTIDIYLDDLKEDKRLEVMFLLRDDLDKWMFIPLATLEFEEEAEF